MPPDGRGTTTAGLAVQVDLLEAQLGCGLHYFAASLDETLYSLGKGEFVGKATLKQCANAIMPCRIGSPDEGSVLADAEM